MYKLKYNFGQYNDIISNYIEVVKNLSMNRLQEQVKNGQIKNKNHDANVLSGCVQNLEEFLYYNLKKYPKDFNYILNSIINKVRTISVLPNNERGIYGKSEVGSRTVYINPDLNNSKYLTGKERTRLYMAHELGHVINNAWIIKVIEYTNQQVRLGNLTQENAQLIHDGCSMLDEATTQNRAEDFAYEVAGKRRPRLAYFRNYKLFDLEKYKTNFDFYGELQEPAIMFARTLRGIGKENDDTRALDLLSQRALSPDFFNNILNEYTRDGQMPAFIKEFQYMGLLKRASYANFGYADSSYLYNSKAYLDYFRKITSSMRDYREPFDTGDGR